MLIEVKVTMQARVTEEEAKKIAQGIRNAAKDAYPAIEYAEMSTWSDDNSSSPMWVDETNWIDVVPHVKYLRPGKGKTLRMWQIFDELQQRVPQYEIDRNDAIKACIAEGFNASTANTQFTKWRLHKKQ